MNRFMNAMKEIDRLLQKGESEGLTKTEEENLRILFDYTDKTVDRVITILAIAAGVIGICTGSYIVFKIFGSLWILNRIPCDMGKNFKPTVEEVSDDRFEVIDVRENWRRYK